MRYKANNDPNYFKDHCLFTNCGSYAFNIRGWYGPDHNADQDDTDLGIYLIEEEGLDYEEALQVLFEEDVERICQDFDVTEVNSKDYPLKSNEELIAFRMCVNRTFYYEELLIDYHFRVKRDGKWMEKCGSGPVREVEDYNERPWIISEDLVYWGPIAYFVKKTI